MAKLFRREPWTNALAQQLRCSGMSQSVRNSVRFSSQGMRPLPGLVEVVGVLVKFAELVEEYMGPFKPR